MRQKIPNFFIVGAAKAGTTSLYHYLNAHDEIYFSPIKEPNFFSTDIDTAEFTSVYKKNVDHIPESFFREKPQKNFQLSFIRDENKYLDLFRWADGESILGECSTSYLYSKEAARKIHEFNPGSKIIIILRNPVERTYSHYLMALRYGFTNLPFRKALEKDRNQNNKGWGKSELFIELSMYYEQISRYLKVFDENQVKIALFDDFKNDPLKLLNTFCHFLGVEEFNSVDDKKYNTALLPRSKNLNKLMVNSGIKNRISNLVNERAKEKLKKMFFQEHYVPDLNSDDRQYLQELFHDDVEKTSKLIQRDLSHWLKTSVPKPGL